MERKIKFRAWDKEENRMLYSEKTHYDVDFRCDENGCLKCYINYSYCDSFGDEYDNWEVLDNIMQYTGLKDKNGKEIYEGDVVEYKDFSGGIYPFKKQPKARGIIKIDNLLTGIYLKGMGIFKESKVEIIGNIHGDPELLEEEE